MLMVTRYRNPDDHSDMLPSVTGEYVRFEDYQKAIAALREALQPLADKWLYPDDVGFDHADEDASDETYDDCWIKRAWIRAARLALASL